MISVAWKKRVLLIYWNVLNHKGASYLTEQQVVIRISGPPLGRPATNCVKEIKKATTVR